MVLQGDAITLLWVYGGWVCGVGCGRGLGLESSGSGQDFGSTIECDDVSLLSVCLLFFFSRSPISRTLPTTFHSWSTSASPRYGTKKDEPEDITVSSVNAKKRDCMILEP